jgi:hypothetical protein
MFFPELTVLHARLALISVDRWTNTTDGSVEETQILYIKLRCVTWQFVWSVL